MSERPFEPPQDLHELGLTAGRSRSRGRREVLLELMIERELDRAEPRRQQRLRRRGGLALEREQRAARLRGS